MLDELARHGLEGSDDKVLLQSFDSEALRRARRDLGSNLRMVQLIGDNSWDESPDDFDYLCSPAGLAEIVQYAQGIGPWLPQVIDIEDDGVSDISELTTRAQQLGLFVHAYTLRADQLPSSIGSMAEAVRILTKEVGLDGVFTDHPDQVIQQLPAGDTR